MKKRQYIRRPVINVPSNYRKDPRYIELIEQVQPFPEQLEAANEMLDAAVKGRARVQLLIAATQSGKSKVAEIVVKMLVHYACQNKLPVTQDAETIGHTALYLVGQPSIDLRSQAGTMFCVEHLTENGNVHVELLLNIRNLIEYCKSTAIVPAVICIDESHVACSDSTKNYPELLKILAETWKNTTMILVSATPHSIIHNLTATKDHYQLPVLNAEVALTLKKNGDGYHGLSELYYNDQICMLNSASLDFRTPSPERERFINTVRASQKRVAFIRIQANIGPRVEEILNERLSDIKIIRLGNDKWKGYERTDMTNLSDFRQTYANHVNANSTTKIIVLVRENMKAGIDLGRTIKGDTAAVWETYKSSLASSVQGLVARIAGYADNKTDFLGFIYFPLLKDYIQATQILYKTGGIQPLKNFINTINDNALLPYRKREEMHARVDSNGGPTGKQRALTQDYELEYTIAVDLGKPTTDIEVLAMTVSNELFDAQLYHVICHSYNQVQSRLSLGQDRTKSKKYGKRRHVNRLLQSDYFDGTRHKFREVFEQFAKGESVSFNSLARPGGRGDEDAEYGILYAYKGLASSHDPLSKTDIEWMVDCVGQRGMVYRDSEYNQNELVMVIVKRGAPLEMAKAPTNIGSVFCKGKNSPLKTVV